MLSVTGVGQCTPSDGPLLLLTVGAMRCTLGDSMLLLLVASARRCALGVDLLLLPCFFLGVSVYWLNSWLLEGMLFLICTDHVGCSRFENTSSLRNPTF